eukprot:CAMPEP_0184498666 /NCGR_PEP_ID=MMETSP0113_2-20130426/39521_1 /TAXON_ID=91329 /ORGANISM="Norrisiella sphaerica, Strain BC52" /LENGTH=1053 /DNA_ID=CAMNT_0026886283 /DNA_START=96 /DNA_END=3257 /DNA_ORIENTATION=+
MNKNILRIPVPDSKLERESLSSKIFKKGGYGALDESDQVLSAFTPAVTPTTSVPGSWNDEKNPSEKTEGGGYTAAEEEEKVDQKMRRNYRGRYENRRQSAPDWGSRWAAEMKRMEGNGEPSHEDIMLAAGIVADATRGFSYQEGDQAQRNSIFPLYLSTRGKHRNSSFHISGPYSSFLRYCRPFGDIYQIGMVVVAVLHCSLLGLELPSTDQEHLPPFKAFRLLPLSIESLELLIIMVYLGDLVLMFTLKGVKSTLEQRWNITYMILCALFIVDITQAMILTEEDLVFRGHAGRWLTRPLRSVFIVIKIRTLRQLVAAMLKATLKVFEVMVLALVLITFYAVIGVALFKDDYRNLKDSQFRDSFSSFGRASLSLTVLLTTENYPDVFFPALNGNYGPVLASLYFFTYFVAGVWALFNLILAVIFDSFQDQRVKAVVRQRVREHSALVKAHNLLSRPVRTFRSLSGPNSPKQEGEGRGEPDEGDLTQKEERGSYAKLRRRRNTVDERKHRARPETIKGVSFKIFTNFLQYLDTHRNRRLEEVRVMFHTMCQPNVLGVQRRQWVRLLDVLQLRITKLKLGRYKRHRSRKRESGNSSVAVSANTDAGKTNADALNTSSESLGPAREERVESETSEGENMPVKATSHRVKWRKRASTESPRKLPRYLTKSRISSVEGSTQDLEESSSTLLPIQEQTVQSSFSRCLGAIWRPRLLAQIGFQAAIYLSAFALTLYGDPDQEFLGNVLSVLCMCVFMAELLMYSTDIGFKPYFKEHPADVGIAISSVFVELCLFGRWLAIGRSVRVLRVVTTNRRLRRLVKSLIGTLQTVLWLLVLLAVVFYIFVVIGIQLFSYRALGREPYHKIESFDGFWNAVLSLFQISTTNNWNDVMFTVLPDTRLSYSLYFVSFYFIVCMVVLNVVTALIIQGFSRNQELVEEESWKIHTRDGFFKITRIAPWAHQIVQNAQPALRDKELLEDAKEIIDDSHELGFSSRKDADDGQRAGARKGRGSKTIRRRQGSSQNLISSSAENSAHDLSSLADGCEDQRPPKLTIQTVPPLE